MTWAPGQHLGAAAPYEGITAPPTWRDIEGVCERVLGKPDLRTARAVVSRRGVYKSDRPQYPEAYKTAPGDYTHLPGFTGPKKPKVKRVQPKVKKKVQPKVKKKVQPKVKKQRKQTQSERIAASLQHLFGS